MIELKNIQLSYDQPLFKEASLVIKDQSICAIIGKSGCGKTTLLYMLGLIAPLSMSSYQFDGEELTSLNQYEQTLFKKQYISYIFQTKNVLMEMTCYENLVLTYQLYNITFTNEDIDEKLKQVNLLHCKHTLASALSGGELQRLAIIMGIIKSPQLLILDEPTSSLDDDNKQRIMQLLVEIKQKYKIKIVIASHDEKISEIADMIYTIEHQKLRLTKDQTALVNPCLLPSKKKYHSLKFCYQYIQYTVKKHQRLNIIFMIICSFCIIGCLIGNGLKNGYLNYIENILADLQTNEFQIVNYPKLQDHFVKDQIIFPSFNINDIEAIKNQPVVKQVYPFFEVKGLDLFFNQQSLKDFPIIIMPYYPETKLKNYVTRGEYKDDGIYISSVIYSTLNNNYQGKIEGQGNFPINKTNDEIQYQSYSLSLNIDGVIDSSFKNPYSYSSEYVIYMPYSQLDLILNELHSEYIPSSIIGYVDNYQDLSILENQIDTTTQSIKTSLLDIEEFISQSEDYTKMIKTLSVSLFVITGVLLTLYFNQKISFKKQEYALLQTMGVTLFNFITISLIETTKLISKIIVITLFSVFIIQTFIIKLINIKYQLPLNELIIIIVVFSIIIILIPLILSVFKISSYQPLKVYRESD